MKKTHSMSKMTSARQNTATGSGSRPTGGKFPIASTAPKNARHLDTRAAKGYLK